MTLEKQFCGRCTGLYVCQKIGSDWYCQWCFEAMANDPETAKSFVQMCEYYGIRNVD